MSLKRLQLLIVLENPNDDEPEAIELQELTPQSMALLRAAADELMILDVLLEVFRMRGAYEDHKLIIAPCYTAPAPTGARVLLASV